MSEYAINYQEQIKYLTQLQKVDEELRKLIERRGSLPLIIDELKHQTAKLEGKKTTAKQRIEDHQKAITVQQAKVVEAQTRAVQYQKKSKNTTSKQELDLIMEDIELQKIEVLLCEKKIKEHQNTVIVEENKIQLLDKEIEEKKLSITEKEDLLKKIDEENQQQQELLEKKRQTVYKRILIDVYTLYECVISKYQNTVVDIHNQACGGCNLIVPLQLRVEVEEQQKKIHTCPHCNRILAYVKEEQKKKRVRRRATKPSSNNAS